MREGEEARCPQRGKTAPTGIAVVKAFAQRYLPLPFRMKRRALITQLPATTVVEVASPHDYTSRGAMTRQLRMATAPLRRQPPPPDE